MRHPVVLATSNFLIPNATFFAEVVAFVVVLEVLRRYVLPPLNKAMNERQELIRKQIEDTAAAKVRLDEAEAEYREAILSTKREASRVREEAAEEKAQIIAEARVAAQTQVEEILARGIERINSEREQAVRALHDEVGGLAVTLAEKIVRSALDNDALQRHVVEDFLASLGGEKL